MVGAFEYWKGFIQCWHNYRTGSFSRRTLFVKLVIVTFGWSVGWSVSQSVAQSADVLSCGLVPGLL